MGFEPWLSGPVFEPLKRLAYFRKFFIDGGTVVLPNGTDIAPDTLYEAARAEAKAVAADDGENQTPRWLNADRWPANKTDVWVRCGRHCAKP